MPRVQARFCLQLLLERDPRRPRLETHQNQQK